MNLSPDELRMLALCAPTILRMLKSKEDRIITRMYGEFRNGKTEQLTALAELACMRDLQHEIQSALVRNEKGNE